MLLVTTEPAIHRLTSRGSCREQGVNFESKLVTVGLIMIGQTGVEGVMGVQ